MKMIASVQETRQTNGRRHTEAFVALLEGVRIGKLEESSSHLPVMTLQRVHSYEFQTIRRIEL
jgi:hypothetical protein